MSRHRYLVTYDIANDKRRTKVYATLGNFGERLQYSVFRCDLNARERLSLEAALRPCIHHEDDQVLFIALGPADGPSAQNIESLGRPYVPERRVRVV